MSINFSSIVNNALSENIGIDLGSEMTRIYIQGRGIVLCEHTATAIDTRNGEIIAYGDEAHKMLGKNPMGTKVILPIKNGYIANIDMTVKMLSEYILRVYKKTLLKPRIIIAVRSDITVVQRHAIENALKDIGARCVYMIDAPIAAASGAGCDISLPRAMFAVHMGAGYCDMASISLGRRVNGSSIDIGGNTLTEDIITHIKKNHNLIIGFQTAENVKKKIGCAVSFDKIATMNVSGCDITTGVPRFVSVSSEEIKDCLSASLLKIADAIKLAIKDAPTEILPDIIDSGILLTGGGAKLYGFDKFLHTNLEMKVYNAANMTDCTITGIGKELSKLDEQSVREGKFYYEVD